MRTREREKERQTESRDTNRQTESRDRNKQTDQDRKKVKKLDYDAADLVVIIFDDVAVVVESQCQPQDVKVFGCQHLKWAKVFTFPLAETGTEGTLTMKWPQGEVGCYVYSGLRSLLSRSLKQEGREHRL